MPGIRFDRYRLDLAAGRLLRDEAPVELRPKTFAVLGGHRAFKLRFRPTPGYGRYVKLPRNPTPPRLAAP
jgi:hypothetical protein